MIQRLLLLCLSLLLLACQTTGPMSTMTWLSRQQQLTQVQNWHVMGALGVRYEHKAWNATVHWQQQQNNYEMNFVAPLGQGTMALTGSPKQVRLRTLENKILTADTPENLIRKAMGWQIPISNLKYWVRGLPLPNQKATVTYDQFNHIKQLKQLGWLVEYQRYINIGGVDLPSRITLKKWPMRLKLVIKKWQL